MLLLSRRTCTAGPVRTGLAVAVAAAAASPDAAPKNSRRETTLVMVHLRLDIWV